MVKAQLDSVYLDDLGTKIRRAHHFALREGLKLRYNGTYLEPFQIDLISTPELRPIEKRVSVDQDVDLQIIAGVGESEPTDAGWYVFCNERMVLSADQSATTGWGESSIERSSPKYHNQFARFRGIARFTARDARNLPWNTTKRGVDSTHPAFQRGRAQMVDSLKSVVRFLNLLDRELDSDEQPLRRAVEHAESLGLKPFETVKTSPVLVHPKFVSRRTTASICYRAPLDQVEDLKEETGKHRNEDLAKFCFDYTYKHFVGED